MSQVIFVLRWWFMYAFFCLFLLVFNVFFNKFHLKREKPHKHLPTSTTLVSSNRTSFVGSAIRNFVSKVTRVYFKQTPL